MLEVIGLTKKFSHKTVVSDISLSIAKGKFLGLVGESGSGKSTLARCILYLLPPTSGQVKLAGQVVDGRSLYMRKRMQIVFQDPYSSLNPRMRVRDWIAEPLVIHQICSNLDSEVDRLMERCGLSAQLRRAYPHELSGGQRQRVGIARALASAPDLLICDEPVSALDLSIQAQIIDLLKSLRAELGLTSLFISHDMRVIRAICDDVAVMTGGRIVERGPAEQVLNQPRHPYTQMLLSSIPSRPPKLNCP